LNLIGNAVKFTDSGQIVLSACLDGMESGTCAVHFAVKDTGIGIPPEHRERVFDAFSQADGSFTRRYGGTGLGLAISSKLIELMSGRVWLESEYGKGSTFHFTATFGVPAESDADDALPAGTSVLVGDENPAVLAVMKRVLSEAGAICAAVNSPAGVLAALDSAQTFSCGVLSTAFVNELSQIAHASLRSRLIVTGTQLELKRRPAAAGDGRLKKPILPGDLLAAVRAAARLSDEASTPSLMALSENVVRDAPAGSEDNLVPGEILIAEDNRINRTIVLKALRRAGYSVEAVENGLEATRLVERRQFDLVLMDVQMPEMDGLEATNHIREWEHRMQKPHVPIIAMTAHAMRGDRERCLAAGMDDYLAKPVKTAELLARIQRWTDRERVASDFVTATPGRSFQNARPIPCTGAHPRSQPSETRDLSPDASDAS
jgi:CheY-like chemotaxis protein